MKRRDLIDVALGRVDPDLVIRDVTLVNVLSRELYTADILVKGDRIAAVLEPRQRYSPDIEVIDGQGLFASPGFIDPHVHLESSMIKVVEYARAVIPRGTTMVAADPHEIGNVLGSPGMRALFDEAATTPLRVKLRVPGRIPAVPEWMETSNGELTISGTREMFAWPEAVCLAGDINPNLVLRGDAEQLEKFEIAEELGVLISGQSPGLSGRALSAFVAAGPEDSHVAGSVDEIIENNRVGMRSILALRPGQMLGSKHIEELAQRVKLEKIDTRLFQLCTDDIHAHDLLHEGHLDHRLRVIMESGFDAMEAYQFATINVAQGLRISHDYGSISPGKLADIVLLQDLRSVSVVTTIIGGKVVWANNTYYGPRQSPAYPEWTKSTIRFKGPMKGSELALRSTDNGTTARVRCLIMAAPGRPKSVREEELSVEGGLIMPDPARNINSVAMIERHRATGEIGRGFADCIRIKHGALACSVNHDAHNVAVFGANHVDMAIAAERLAQIGGGYALARDGAIVAELALPVAGLMSEEPIETVAALFAAVEASLRDDLGAEDQDKALMNMNFLALPNIPNYGFTNKGLVASDGRMELVDSLVCCGHAE